MDDSRMSPDIARFVDDGTPPSEILIRVGTPTGTQIRHFWAMPSGPAALPGTSRSALCSSAKLTLTNQTVRSATNPHGGNSYFTQGHQNGVFSTPLQPFYVFWGFRHDSRIQPDAAAFLTKLGSRCARGYEFRRAGIRSLEGADIAGVTTPASARINPSNRRTPCHTDCWRAHSSPAKALSIPAGIPRSGPPDHPFIGEPAQLRNLSRRI